MPFDPILVPYDGSSWSVAAAAHARVLARATGAHTYLVNVVPTPGFTLDIAQSESYGNQMREATSLLVEESRRFDTPVTIDVLEGKPHEAIVAKAHHMKAGLVVIGTRGRTTLAGLLLGGVSRGVILGCPRPVMVVHRNTDAIRQVVVGIEEDGRAQAIAGVAAELARATGADATLVNAVVADRDLARHPEQYGISPEDWAAGIAARREEVFAPVRALFGGPVDERVAFGTAVEAIREVASERRADVVVVGRKGRSGHDVDAWLSVAFALAIRGPFATLVV